MRFLPSFKCCIGKTGIELDLLSEISSIFTGLHSEIFKWQLQVPSKHNFYQVFLHFLIWHPSNGVCCISCPSAALIQSYFCNTPNWQWIEDWLFPGFFAVFSWTWIEDCHQISLQESLETPWNTTYSCNMNIFYLKNGWVRCWICIFYLKNWCNFFCLWVLQYTSKTLDIAQVRAKLEAGVMCKLHKLCNGWKDFNFHCSGGDPSPSAKSIRRGSTSISLSQRSSLSWVVFNEYIISVVWPHGISNCQSVEHMTALLGQKCRGSRFQPMLNWKTMWRCEQMSYSDALMRTRQNSFCQAKGDNVSMRHHHLFTVLTPVVSLN